tara:strand:- start:1124 stop:1426 length:303 start_codon:yes stop_codon:yes gene_type:complete
VLEQLLQLPLMVDRILASPIATMAESQLVATCSKRHIQRQSLNSHVLAELLPKIIIENNLANATCQGNIGNYFAVATYTDNCKPLDRFDKPTSAPTGATA